MMKAPFACVVYEIIEEMCDRVTCIQGVALEALQEASETILVSFFQDVVLCLVHAKRVTLKPVDLAPAKRLRSENTLFRQS